jgi:hypothetical protein
LEQLKKKLSDLTVMFQDLNRKDLPRLQNNLTGDY